MTFSLRELDGADPSTAAALLPVYRGIVASDFGRHPEPDEAMFRSVIHPRVNHDCLLVAADDAAGTAVGYARADRHRVSNQTLAIGTLDVAPNRRREGFGTALLAVTESWARELGCDRLAMSAPLVPGGPEFVERNGGKVVSSYFRNVVDLTAIDVPQYRRWAEGDGDERYRMVRWTEHCPEELVASHVAAMDALQDAPHGDVDLERHRTTPEELRDRESSRIAMGQRRHTVAAIAPDGVMAGYTQIAEYADSSIAMASVTDTAVIPEHRGHGLGLRLKAELALWLREIGPHLEVVETWNNSENEPMLRVNGLLGYTVSEDWREYLFEL